MTAAGQQLELQRLADKALYQLAQARERLNTARMLDEPFRAASWLRHAQRELLDAQDTAETLRQALERFGGNDDA